MLPNNTPKRFSNRRTTFFDENSTDQSNTSAFSAPISSHANPLVNSNADFPTMQQQFPEDPFKGTQPNRNNIPTNPIPTNVGMNNAPNPIANGVGWFASSFMNAAATAIQQPQNSSFPFTNNPTADMLLNAGVGQVYESSRAAVSTGMGRYFSFMDGMKMYFNVDNLYVLKKLILLVFPYRHKNWERKVHMDPSYTPLSAPNSATTSNFFEPTQMPPSSSTTSSDQTRDINEPDLYIPLMAFITYILIVGFVIGSSTDTANNFSPELLASTASKGLMITLLEIFLIKAALYMLDVPTDLHFLDIMSYTSYKYVGICLSILAGIIFGNTGYYIVYGITAIAMVYFMLKTLRRSGVHSSDHSQRMKLDIKHGKRNTFLLIVALLQIPISFYLSFPYAKPLLNILLQKVMTTSAVATGSTTIPTTPSPIEAMTNIPIVGQGATTGTTGGEEESS